MTKGAWENLLNSLKAAREDILAGNFPTVVTTQITSLNDPVLIDELWRFLLLHYEKLIPSWAAALVSSRLAELKKKRPEVRFFIYFFNLGSGRFSSNNKQSKKST